MIRHSISTLFALLLFLPSIGLWAAPPPLQAEPSVRRASALIEQASILSQIPSSRAEAFHLYHMAYILSPNGTAAREMALLAKERTAFLYWMQESLRLNPNDERAVILLAEDYLDRNSFSEAAETYEAYLQRNPSAIRLYPRMAYAYANSGNLDKAVEALSQYLQQNSNEAERIPAEDLLFRILSEQGKRAEAVDLIMRSYRSRTTVSPELLYTTVNRLLTSGYYKDALSLIQDNVALVHGDLDLMSLATTLLIMNGKRNEARQMMLDMVSNKGFAEDELIATIVNHISADRTDNGMINELYLPIGAALQERFPNSYKVSGFYYEMLAMLKQEEPLSRQLEYMVRTYPDSTNVYLTLAQHRIDKKEFDEADSVLDHLIARDGKEATPYLIKSMIEGTHRSNNANAIRVIDQGLHGVPTTDSTGRASLYVAKGDWLYASGKVDEAFVCYDEALSLEPNNVYALNNYAYYLSQVGRDMEKALSMAQKAAMLAPEDANILDSYAYLLYRNGDYLMAGIYMRKAIDLSEKEHATFFEHYAEILIAEEHYDEALEYLEKANAIEPSTKLKDLIEEMKQKL